ncbi:FAD-dependent oxidoreductase [Granulicella arctica]|uniref:FAD-dependent oxidoreductase n=1 Tax=Granulicella arctica TaxID=940613 RepID=UPI0021DFF466|nr:FAD-dependent oxidoreductase [Granulicella arctica]
MNEALHSTVCIVGGGPAGIVMALLLARQGIDVTVLEKHKDFNRDFRGDTIHGATLRVMQELGLLDALLKVPHQQFDHAVASLGGCNYLIADFTTLPSPTNLIALMPQWDLLDFLSAEVRKYRNARILMEHKVAGLMKDQKTGRILGAYVEGDTGTTEVHAALTVGCDGRHAITTDSADLQRIEHGAPIDVLWLRLSRRDSDPETALGNLNYGRMIVMINRKDYFQCGYLIAKDSFETSIKPAGLEKFRQHLVSLVPFLGAPGPDGRSRAEEIQSWDEVSLLPVQVNRLRRWHIPGLLCIGDAAHAMSPVGGIGINLAIQDAVAAARILAPVLRSAQERGSPITEHSLAHVQHRRQLPTRITQTFQTTIHGFLKSYLGRPGPLRAPLVLRMLSRSQLFHRLTARFIGLGVRPEHVR